MTAICTHTYIILFIGMHDSTSPPIHLYSVDIQINTVLNITIMLDLAYLLVSMCHLDQDTPK